MTRSVMCLLLILIMPMAWGCERSQAERNDRVAVRQCEGKLLGIYRSLCSYAEAHDGRLPADIARLVEETTIGLEGDRLNTNVLVCSASTQNVADTRDRATWAGMIRSAPGEHVSYRLVAGGELLDRNRRVPIVVEGMDDHIQGHHVLFSDGSIEFVVRGRTSGR